MKVLSGFSVPDWTDSLALTMIMLDLFQEWKLEQISDSITTLGKNLETKIISNDNHPKKHKEK